MNARSSWLAAACLSAAMGSVLAGDIEFAASRKKLDESRERGGKATTVESRSIVYVIKVTSRSFSPIDDVTVQYNILYETPHHGAKGKAPVEQVAGRQVVGRLVVNKPVEFETTPIKLTTETLDAGWYFPSGAKGTARDRVVGIWLRALGPDGKVLGEYVNPSTVASKYTWKEPK